MSKTTPEQRLQQRTQERDEARRELEAYKLLRKVIPLQYLEELVAVYHAAHNGVRRPDDLGGSVNTQTATHRYHWDDSPAQRVWRNEQKHLNRRAHVLAGRLERIIDLDPHSKQNVAPPPKSR